MSNIEEDIKKLNKYIELVIDKDYCDCNELNVIIGKHCDGSKNVAYAIKNTLAEREEDKKRIKELEVLEDDLKDKRIAYVDTPEFEEKFIAKQKVKDNFNKLITRIKEFKNPERKKYFSIEQIIYLLEQFENKLLEDK
jgi:hypothetical protein